MRLLAQSLLLPFLPLCLVPGFAPTVVQAASFDGRWNVVLTCPKEEKAKGAMAYAYRFAANVKGNVLQAEHHVKGSGGSMTMTGKINDDGNATFDVNGMTGDPKHAAGQVQRGTPYTYTVSAHFSGSSGNGKRNEVRACSLTFKKA